MLNEIYYKTCKRCNIRRHLARFRPLDDTCKVCRWKEENGGE